MESVKKLFGLGKYPMIYVKSNVDSKEYLVRDLPDKQGAADLLAKVRIKLNNLKIHLESKYPDKPQVKQLIQNFRDDPKRFLESTPDAEFTSYSVNKGESVHLCLRQREGADESLVKEEVMVEGMYLLNIESRVTPVNLIDGSTKPYPKSISTGSRPISSG